MWIDRDEGAFDGEMSHIIIALSYKESESAVFHIDLYKLVATEEGKYKLFSFKKDAI